MHLFNEFYENYGKEQENLCSDFGDSLAKIQQVMYTTENVPLSYVGPHAARDYQLEGESDPELHFQEKTRYIPNDRVFSTPVRKLIFNPQNELNSQSFTANTHISFLLLNRYHKRE